MANYIPKGFPQIIPYFVVDGGDSLSFIEKVFDAQELKKHLDENGRIMNAAFKIGEGLIALGSKIPSAIIGTLLLI